MLSRLMRWFQITLSFIRLHAAEIRTSLQKGWGDSASVDPLRNLTVDDVVEKLSEGWVLKGDPAFDAPCRLFDPYADVGWNAYVPVELVRKMINMKIIIEITPVLLRSTRSYRLNPDNAGPLNHYIER